MSESVATLVGLLAEAEDEELARSAQLELDREILSAGLGSNVAAGAARDELRSIEAELRKRRYREDPVLWAREVPKEHIWSKQAEILQSVRDNRKTAVRSCHGPGKSFTAATIVGWWLSNFKPGEAAVVTSAPTGRQVKTILWKEIGRVHARGKLPGRTNQTEWLMHVRQPNGAIKEEIVAFGQKPADMDPTAFQGIHAKRVLVIFDEACGMPGALWIAADSLLSNDACRLLAQGNPDDPQTEFAEVCKPGSGYNIISISAFDTPAFTGEACPSDVLENLVGRVWIEEKRRKWAPGWKWVDANGKPSTAEQGVACIPPLGERVEDANPFWLSKVLGIFPKVSQASGLIPISWIEAAQERELSPSLPVELGVDVGGGGDSSTTCLRSGPVFRIISEDHNPDTMQTCGKVRAERREHKASAVKIDKIGIGQGIVDLGVEEKEPFIGINVGEQPTCNCEDMRAAFKRRPPTEKHYDDCNTELFVNLKAQAWWAVRERFESGEIDLDPNDDDTAAELASLRFKRTSAGKIQIESKDEAKRRGVASPNRAEALMLANLPAPTRTHKPKGGVLW